MITWVSRHSRSARAPATSADPDDAGRVIGAALVGLAVLR